MTLLCFFAGLVAGAILSWAADWLPRFASRRPTEMSRARLFLATMHLIVHAARGQTVPGVILLCAGIELLTAFLFVFLSWQAGLGWNFFSMAIGICFFLLIAVVDLRHRLILNVMIVPGMLAVLLANLAAGSDLARALAGAAFGSIVFLAVTLLRPGQLGAGDVKLAALIGFLFGFPSVLWALGLGVFAGALAAILLISRGGFSRQSQIPYAPFLCGGALVALFYSPLTVIR